MAAHRGHWTGGLRGTGVDDGVWGWRQRRKGLDCTGYITRHSWLSPMRFNARSRTSTAIPGKVLSSGFCRLSFCASDAIRVRRRPSVADFQVLSRLSFIIHQVPHRDDICLPMLIKSARSRGQADT